jgi:hypothetical protein
MPKHREWHICPSDINSELKLQQSKVCSETIHKLGIKLNTYLTVTARLQTSDATEVS